MAIRVGNLTNFVTFTSNLKNFVIILAGFRLYRHRFLAANIHFPALLVLRSTKSSTWIFKNWLILSQNWNFSVISRKALTLAWVASRCSLFSRFSFFSIFCKSHLYHVARERERTIRYFLSKIDIVAVQKCALFVCRSWRRLQNKYSFAEICFDTAEKEPYKN